MAGVSGAHGAFGARARVLAALAATLASFGCYRVPEGKGAITDVTIRGLSDVDDERLEERLATRESSRFLGLFAGVVYEYEVYDRYALERDLARIERYLRARGYYEARVQAARVVEEEGKVRVTIEVEQGPPVTVDAMTVSGDGAAPPTTRDRVRAAVRKVMPLGARLDEDTLGEAEAAALGALTSNGHAAAKVSRRAEVDLATHTARIFFDVEPGPVTRFGPVTFEGTGELPEGVLRRIFDVAEGEPYSSAALEDGRRALLELGVLASVNVETDLSNVAENVPVHVRCEPGKLRAFLIGAGGEFDALKTDLHGVLGWQNANFLGGLRRLELRAKPGIVLYPTRLPNVPPPEKVLYEHRFRAGLRQPALIESRTVGLATGEYSVYPVLLPTPTENVLGYHELRAETGLERVFGKVFVSPQYGVQANFPFDYIGRTPGVETIVVSYTELSTHLDLRDDPVKPRRGLYVGTELQTAGGPLGGDADDVRVHPEVRAYVPLPKRVTLALRGSVGFLFPFNYGERAEVNFRNPGPSRIEETSRDYQLLFFRGFFGGGPTSNRGYPLRAVGPHDLIPFLSPAGQSIAGLGCNPSDPACRLPTGGLSLWEASAELRFVVSGPVSMATFCDAGDVSPFRVDIRLDHPHLSCGAGARYDTPVGPIRLDVGYRIPGLQFPEGDPFEQVPSTIFGAPIAIAFAIGEAF